jgi:hypothetical protein
MIVSGTATPLPFDLHPGEALKHAVRAHWIMFARLLGAYQEWNRDYLYVTDKRIVMRRGYVRRTLKMFPLNNVMYVFSADTPFSRMLGYGKIDVVSPGEKGPEAYSVLDPAPVPAALANSIMLLIAKPSPEGPLPVQVVGPTPPPFRRTPRPGGGGNGGRPGFGEPAEPAEPSGSAA